MRTIPPARNELIAHPMRMRILAALSGRELTVDQLMDLLEGASVASLYRHVALMIDAGLLEVVAERSEAGRKERVLAVAAGGGVLDRHQIDPDSVEENSHYVNVFLTELMTGYADAVRDESVRPGDWRCRGHVLYLTPEESQELYQALAETLSRFEGRPRTPDRRRRRVALVNLPLRDLPMSEDTPKRNTP